MRALESDAAGATLFVLQALIVLVVLWVLVIVPV
jgi:hypothetical protein